ncbi:adenylate kinase 4 [Anaeramoeba ignava]|uniref:Adenylate kinase 4 n=1 Tax=Anaeramoeba ignava TaxID=1746090 RepID=A0A9Q0LQ77_ANAIG|nr:adenylate kinase 4 [Anaeramoeba ignava]|eukprot:Anaeramoba_ignava/a350144_39.p1 GENE.a350144_39~~a350144_39.p1  ORF type:complete len:231 (-),score=75.22 a350144_39:64-732(-)
MEFKKFLSFLGPPGCGKGTQAPKVTDKYQLQFLSTGDVFRQAIKDETDLGKKAKDFVSNGKLVPDSIVIDMISERIFEEVKKTEGILFDGFPRTYTQAIALDKMLQKFRARVHAVISFDVPDSVLFERITGRLTHIPSGRTYHKTFKPPKIPMKDDVTGEDLVQRKDDTPEYLTRRLKEFHENADLIKDHYRKLGVLISVNANQSINSVTNEVLTSINKLLK